MAATPHITIEVKQAWWLMPLYWLTFCRLVPRRAAVWLMCRSVKSRIGDGEWKRVDLTPQQIADAFVEEESEVPHSPSAQTPPTNE